MNLQALYDLKERLEYAAIAGTGLLQEDFRLRRAVDALAPLAGASPVFGKISAAAKALLAAPQPERSTQLMDLLSLVDAVIYTQGVTNVPGVLDPLVPGNGTYVPVSYGALQPLLTALSGTGSGRTALIRECWQNHPEYFSDFRVLPHVVSALGDSYAELAEMIASILMKQGPTVIPLLKDGFDPAGKKEMARRVCIIAKLAGAAENEWFISILPDSKKEVRETVIQALGLCQENGQLLLDLCRSERGKLKEAAMRSLAKMPQAAAAPFWEKEAEKKSASVFCLAGVDSPLAADLTAQALRKFLEELMERGRTYDSGTLDHLSRLTAAACGKYSSRTEEMWRWIGANMTRFSQILPEQNVRNCDLSVAEHLQRMLMQSILIDPRPERLALVRALAEEDRTWFLCGAFLTDLAELSAGALYEAYAPLIVRTGLLKRESPGERSDRVQILRGLAVVNWNEGLRSYCAEFIRYDPLTGMPVLSARKLDGLDGRWVALLTDPKVKDDGGVHHLSSHVWFRRIDPARGWLLGRMIDQDDPEVCGMIGSWFYEYTMETGSLQETCPYLLPCGWKNWKGVLVQCARKQGTLNFDLIYTVLRQIPMSNAEKAEELKGLDALAQNKQVRVQFRWPHEWVLRQIELLNAGLDAEL